MASFRKCVFTQAFSFSLISSPSPLKISLSFTFSITSKSTGKILFDPESSERGSSNFHHLEMMIHLCGEFHSDFLNKTNNKNKYFNKRNRLENIIYNKDTKNKDSYNIIKNKLIEHNINDNMLSELLCKMLILDPKKRITIKEILSNKWLS